MAESTKKTWSSNLTLHSQVSPFESPVPVTHKLGNVKPASWKRFNISGILTTVYGLDELHNKSDIACLWLLHGRGDTQDSMAFLAGAFLGAWAAKRSQGQPALICVAFDQRNHGSRMVDPRANESWKAGNPTHAQDMFSIFSGTASDVSTLITHLPSYLLLRPSQHICCGISLGGHATWQLILRDPRVTAAVIIVGCPDYVRLMTDRGIRSKLATCVGSNPPGRNFLGSRDFPRSLVEAVEQSDPAGLLLGELDVVTGDDHLHPPSEAEKIKLRSIMIPRLSGKHILTLSGGKDKLVPYKHNESFLSWLKRALDKQSGWFNDHNTSLTDIIDDDAGHEFSARMRAEAETWLCRLLAEGSPNDRESKI